jgi:hypothetical protein
MLPCSQPTNTQEEGYTIVSVELSGVGIWNMLDS